jgi:ABC-type multidrug transport system ATPase subunit
MYTGGPSELRTDNQPVKSSTPLAVRTELLTKRFAALTAVDHPSLSVSPGTIFGLLGTNGAGKTTVIKMLTTLRTLMINGGISSFGLRTDQHG